MRFKLFQKQGTETFHRIVSGRKWVGRVAQHHDGTFIGIIGKTMVKGFPTERAAFDAVVSQHLGFANVQALQEKNRQVHAQNSHNRAVARHAINEIMNGNFKPLDELFGIK